MVLATVPPTVDALALPIGIVFVKVPSVAEALISTETVQDAAAATETPSAPPERLKDVAPGVALTVPPLQVVAALGAAATVKPDGKGSVTDRLVNRPALATLLRVTVRRVVPPAPTEVGRNALVFVMAVVTPSVRVTAVELLPSEVTSALAGMVLVWVAIVALPPTSTGTVIVQLAERGIVPPAMENEVAPAGAVIVPPQVVAGAGDAATVKPAPIVVRSSEMLVMAAAVVVLEFVRVSVSVLVPLRGTEVGLKTLAKVMARIVKVADAAG